MVRGRIVPLGNSAAIAIEKKSLLENSLKFGQEVEVTIWTPALEKRRKSALKKMFGSARGAKPLEDEFED